MAEVFTDSFRRRLAGRLGQAGEEAKMLAHLPMKAALGDTDLALIGLPGSPTGHLVVRRSALLECLAATFETLWSLAIPLPDTGGAPGGQSVPHDREVLRLLADGATDDAIARKLRISRRTAQRRVKNLLETLDAETRFQAGVQSSRRNWI